MSTFTQIHLHITFAVKYRLALIAPVWREELHRYSSTIIQNRSHKLLAIYAMPDHIHLLIGHRPSDALPDLMRDLKKDTTAWINQRGFTERPFQWQEGYGAFSMHRDLVPTVCNYIENQEAIHARRTYRQELTGILNEYGVPFKPEYLNADLC
jgi:putative transposase